MVELPKIPPVMSSVRLQAPGGVEGLTLERFETPRPAAGEALVRVHAASITRGELDWPEDRLPATPSYEFSGVIAALAPDVEGLSVGDEVYALTDFDRDGAAADYMVVQASFLAPKPRTLGHAEAATIPLAALSAWQGLFDHGRLTKGERVLIHGAAGGVGGFAAQLARWSGAHTVGTVSTANLEAAGELGLEQVVDHTSVRFEDVVEPVDVVFDTVGGDLLERSFDVVRTGGRIVSIAEEPPEGHDEARGIEASYFLVQPDRGQLVELSNMVEDGDLRPLVDAVYPLAEARAAFERSLGDRRRGKIVLRVVEG